jgi:hypothetical protein
VPGLCQAEPFTVWAESGDIWARNNDTGYQWNITKDWDEPCSNPDVAAYTAVWETSNNVFPSIYAYDLDDRFPADLFPVYISIDKGTPLGPRVGVVDTAGWGDYWCAWQMAGDIWANHIQPPLSSGAARLHRLVRRGGRHAAVYGRQRHAGGPAPARDTGTEHAGAAGWPGSVPDPGVQTITAVVISASRRPHGCFFF